MIFMFGYAPFFNFNSMPVAVYRCAKKKCYFTVVESSELSLFIYTVVKYPSQIYDIVYVTKNYFEQ